MDINCKDCKAKECKCQFGCGKKAIRQFFDVSCEPMDQDICLCREHAKNLGLIK